MSRESSANIKFLQNWARSLVLDRGHIGYRVKIPFFSCKYSLISSLSEIKQSGDTHSNS